MVGCFTDTTHFMSVMPIKSQASSRGALIAESINVIAVLVRDGTGRRHAELAQVTGLDEHSDYRILPITPQTNRVFS